MWTENYKDYLNKLIYDKGADEKLKKIQCLVDVDSKCTETKVYFKLHFKKSVLSDLINKNKLESVLKMTDEKNSSYSNMHMFNSKGVITKYESAEKILKEFYLIRLAYYVKRKEHKLRVLKRELDIIAMKIKFINDFINNEIEIIEMEDADIYEQLEEREYIKFPKNPRELDYDEDVATYDYLLNMMIRTLTKRKNEELRKQHELRETEYKALLEKDICDIWREDLTAFEDMYERCLEEHAEMMSNTNSGDGKKTKGKRTKRVRKKKTINL